MKGTECQNEECTVSQTGICLLNNLPDGCPYRVSENDVSAGSDSAYDEPVLTAPHDAARFPPNGVLGMHDVRALMGKDYCRMIGLLGAPNSGKTACLVSLYLLLAHDRVDDFTFADSKSLRELDELAQGARRWPGAMPEQMTAHTERADDRSAGFLHFKLLRKSDHVRLHLLIPDLPGEWSTSLIENNRTDRLSFLRAADSIWIMVDGQSLTSKSQRLNAIHRAKVLIDRLEAFLSPDTPPLRLVVTRLDMAKPDKETLQEISDHAFQRSINLDVSQIASFSSNDCITAGAGIADLINQTVAAPIANGDFWPDSPETAYGSRHALRVSTGEIF